MDRQGASYRGGAIQIRAAEARKLHWEALGRPQIIRLDYNRKAALLLSMTFLSRNYTERANISNRLPPVKRSGLPWLKT